MNEQYLIDKLHDFYNIYHYIPQQRDLIHTLDYPSYGTYIKEFGSWANTLKAAGFDPEISQYTYTSEELAGALWDYYYTYGKYPSSVDIDNNPNYPSATTFANRFGSWDAAYQYAEMPRSAQIRSDLSDKPDICEICGTIKSIQWNNLNGLKVCHKCKSSNRKYIHGILNPNSSVGIAVITEHITSEILQDCIKCNTFESFNFPYDLISKSLGTINVKTSALTQYNTWNFGKKKNQTIPDYYICLGFNEDRTEIIKVFQIPGDSDIITKCGISITNSTRGLKRSQQYEIDSNPYNEIYQNLDIYTLPEFSNYNNDN